ncbi:MAG: hypothetical protein WCX63_09175, partial [Methanoregula sp.]
MLLFFDTETTGLPRYSATNPTDKWPRVMQLAWSLYDTEGNQESRNSFIIYPTDFTIPMDSARIHGITTERAKSQRRVAAQGAPAVQRSRGAGDHRH